MIAVYIDIKMSVLLQSLAKHSVAAIGGDDEHLALDFEEQHSRLH